MNADGTVDEIDGELPIAEAPKARPPSTLSSLFPPTLNVAPSVIAPSVVSPLVVPQTLETLSVTPSIPANVADESLVDVADAAGVSVAKIEPTPIIDRNFFVEVDQLMRGASALKGKLDTLTDRESVLTVDVGISKGVLGLKKEMEGALEALQLLAHERSVGSFERMLTAIAQDVQPGNPTEIRLKLGTERSMPALGIYASVNSEPEAITSGALNNVVSTGLRFITLARSGRAKFMVLDEADCFIENGDVNNFFGVIDQLSRDAGIQTVCITHHDASAFEEKFRIYKISPVDSNDKWPRRIPELVSNGNMQPSAVQDGYFSFIEAENFESYTSGRIELSPGVTVITGKNGRGKSSWARMLRGNLLGGATDDNIRHGKPSSTVTVGFSDGRALTHTRRRKGNPKGEYILHSPESWAFAAVNKDSWKKNDNAPRPLHHTEGALLPNWVPKETGVADVDDINVALWGQLSPVFMLDQPASKQASLLSIGRESGHLFSMNELYKKDVLQANNTSREGEKEIAAIRITVKTLEPLSQIICELEAARGQVETLFTEQARIAAGQLLIGQIEDQQRTLDALAQWAQAAKGLPQQPEIKTTEAISVWFENCNLAQVAISMKSDATVPTPPNLHNESAASILMSAMLEASAAAQMAGKMPIVPGAPEVIATRHIEAVVFDMERLKWAASLSRIAQHEPPVIAPTQHIEQWFSDTRTAEAQRILPRIQMVEPPEISATTEGLALVTDFVRNRQIFNSSKANLILIHEELAKLEAASSRAVEVLGSQWELSPDRIERLASQIVQSIKEIPGKKPIALCGVDDLREHLGLVAKEGYAHGLNEGLSRGLSDPKSLNRLKAGGDGAEGPSGLLMHSGPT